MADSIIAVAAFGGDKALLATDQTAGVHTMKVTTDAPSDGLAIWGFGAAKIVLGTVRSGGVHTLCVTTDAPDSAVVLAGAMGSQVRCGSVASNGVHVICVTADAANSAAAIKGFGAEILRLATVFGGGVHVLAVTDSADGALAVSSFGANKTLLASSVSGGTHSLAVDGLAPVYDPDASAFIERAAITTPSYISAVRSLVSALKQNGLWTKLDWMNLYCAVDDIGGAGKNLVRDDFHTTFVNGPSFVSGQGVIFTSNKYGLVDYDCANDHIALQKDSAVAFAWAETFSGSYPGDSGAMIGGVGSSPQSAIRLRPSYNTSSIAGFDLNNGNTAASGATSQASYTGFYCSIRTDSASVSLRKNSNQICTSASSSTNLPSPYMAVGAVRFENGFTDEFYLGRLSIVGLGGGMSDSDTDKLFNALTDFRAAVGL